jgi:YfiH family protein
MTIITASSPTGHNDKSGDTGNRVPINNKRGYSDLYAQGGVLRVGALDHFPELLHAISTRTAPDGDDWNLSAKRGTPKHPPSPETAFANREKLARLLNITPDRIVGCRQMHGTQVVRVYEHDGGKGMTADNPSIEDTDGMVTDVPGLYLMALSADCPPVFFYDPTRQVVGLAHSGWKGTVGRIAGNVVEAMVDDFGSDVRDIVAVVGPGIGPCCYSVGENVIEAVERGFMNAWARDAQWDTRPLLEKRGDLVYFNLRETIRRALLEAGVLPENITVEEVCTADNIDLLYSHRAEKGQCGLFGAVLGIRG